MSTENHVTDEDLAEALRLDADLPGFDERDLRGYSPAFQRWAELARALLPALARLELARRQPVDVEKEVEREAAATYRRYYESSHPGADASGLRAPPSHWRAAVRPHAEERGRLARENASLLADLMQVHTANDGLASRVGELIAEVARRRADIDEMQAAYRVGHDEEVAYRRGLEANLEALRTKALALTEHLVNAGVGDDDIGPDTIDLALIEAVRAELDKPSGANSATQAQRVLAEALAEAHANGEVADAWKALAEARDDQRCAELDVHTRGGMADDDASARALAAVEGCYRALRALGIDPDAAESEAK